MRIIALLLAFAVFSVAGRRYWKTLFDIQSKSILSAYRSNAHSTLCALLPCDGDIKHYFDEVDTVELVEILKANGPRALAKIYLEGYDVAEIRYAYLWLAPSYKSPTGFKMSKGYICHTEFCKGDLEY